MARFFRVKHFDLTCQSMIKMRASLNQIFIDGNFENKEVILSPV